MTMVCWSQPVCRHVEWLKSANGTDFNHGNSLWEPPTTPETLLSILPGHLPHILGQSDGAAIL